MFSMNCTISSNFFPFNSTNSTIFHFSLLYNFHIYILFFQFSLLAISNFYFYSVIYFILLRFPRFFTNCTNSKLFFHYRQYIYFLFPYINKLNNSTFHFIFNYSIFSYFHLFGHDATTTKRP